MELTLKHTISEKVVFISMKYIILMIREFVELIKFLESLHGIAYISWDKA